MANEDFDRNLINLEMECPDCHHKNPGDSNFCNACGCTLSNFPGFSSVNSTTDGERKHVTILFSDLTGYTTMSERLDPEEVKEISGTIFGGVAKIITKYNGFIEKYIGDAVMAVFGAYKSSEDDPIRAIRAAMEIHQYTIDLNNEYEERIGQPLQMHTGINTGLVVTGEMNLDKGTHGLSGDTINVASRLSSYGKAGDIIVGQCTYDITNGHFEFEKIAPVVLKGRSVPVSVYKVSGVKEKPIKIHRLHGMRAKLIGRKMELNKLENAFIRLKDDRKGNLICIIGPAGSGKSRLVDEFRSYLDLEKFQWFYGNAYPFSKNIPYFPLTNLLRQAFRIEEGDSPGKIRIKVETGISDLFGYPSDFIPYIGSLFSLKYAEIENINPEFWKLKVQAAVKKVLEILSVRGPVIVCLEDIHWADPSSLELIRLLLVDFNYPILFICVYRPTISLFTKNEIKCIRNSYSEILLHDLSPPEAQSMVKSLLKTESIPLALQRLIQDKVEGNPFYIEELINSLVDSEILICGDKGWKITRPMGRNEISVTINGVISGRIDHLEKETKRILQEASVIGREFPYEIIAQITDSKYHIDRCLKDLERLDFINAKDNQPRVDYMFKHGLTQEVVYNTLLKSDRRKVHEKIALKMEEFFEDRKMEFAETIAYHFLLGNSSDRSTKYLIMSGEKSFNRYSLEESHEYFSQAYKIIEGKNRKTKKDQETLIELLIKWAEPLHFRGDYAKLCEIFYEHEHIAITIDDKEKLGMFYNWLGWALRQRNILNDSNKYLFQALKIGEDFNNNEIKSLACSWISLNYAELGQFESGIENAKRARNLSSSLKSDFLYRWALWGLAFNYYFKGECNEISDVGYMLKEMAEKRSDIRASVSSNIVLGLSRTAMGDTYSAIEFFQKAIQLSIDPYLSALSKLFLGMNYANNRQLKEAEETLVDVMSFSERFGIETLKAPAELFRAIVLLIKGDLNKGVQITKGLVNLFLRNRNKYRYAAANYILGKVYLDIVQRVRPVSLSFLVRNLGFLLKNLFYARRNARQYFLKAIDASEQHGYMGVLGQSYFGLGLLYKAVGKSEIAKENLIKAKKLFKDYEANMYLTQVEEELLSMK